MKMYYPKLKILITEVNWTHAVLRFSFTLNTSVKNKSVFDSIKIIDHKIFSGNTTPLAKHLTKKPLQVPRKP